MSFCDLLTNNHPRNPLTFYNLFLSDLLFPFARFRSVLALYALLLPPSGRSDDVLWSNEHHHYDSLKYIGMERAFAKRSLSAVSNRAAKGTEQER